MLGEVEFNEEQLSSQELLAWEGLPKGRRAGEAPLGVSVVQWKNTQHRALGDCSGQPAIAPLASGFRFPVLRVAL